MKSLKNFFVAILNTLLFFIIAIMTVTIITKEVIQKELIGSSFKTMIITEVSSNDNIKDKDEIVDKIDSKEINDIFNNILKDYAKNDATQGYKVSKKTVDSIINYFVDHEKELEELIGKDIDINEITSNESKEELEKQLNNSLSKLDENYGVDLLKYFKMYDFFTSYEFKLILIGFILIILIILILITGQKDIVLSSIGTSLSVNGTIILLGYIVLVYVIPNIFLIEDFKKIVNTFDLKIIMIIGLIELAIGICFFILKNALVKTKITKMDK
ncbi:MAG: hypothetical protein E7158_03435 [Firmicutes bacterium]|nr:hypothetical protein [Bacillota bacterium]